MTPQLSQHCISSFVGNVVPLRLLGVEEYSMEPIRWTVSSPCVQITSFENAADAPFTDGVLLTFLCEGYACVTAYYRGTAYQCHVSVRRRMNTPSQKGLYYYIGDFHDHTAKTHKREEFLQRLERIPLDYLKQVQLEGKLDFAVVSDHACLLNGREYFRGFWDAFTLGEQQLIVFAGSEAEVSPVVHDRYGIPHKVGGEIVTVNADDCADVPSWDAFFGRYRTSPFAISILAHPQIIGISKKGVWNFRLDQNKSPCLQKMLKGVEMGNGTERSSNHIHEYIYSVALDNGFRVSTTCSSDCHGPIWGAGIFPGKTVIMAPEKSREAFMDAIENRRFYACESGNVKLYYEVNGQAAPADLSADSTYRFHVELDLLQPENGGMPIRLEVISDYGRTVWETDDIHKEMDFTVHSDTARYFYLRFVDAKAKKTWSVPVWTGRAFDAVQSETLNPIDKTAFTAWDEESNCDASVLLNDDPAQPYFAGTPTCSILIDMGKPRKISALGHYPTMMDIKAISAAGEKASVRVSQFPVRYRLETGLTQDEMAVRSEGRFRVFGEEELIRFPEHEARYVRLRILSTAGKECGRVNYQDCEVSMAELTLYSR